MKNILRDHKSLLLVIIGLGALLAAFVLDPLRGQPLIIGWTQFLLILFGLAAWVASVPAIQRALRAWLETSRAQTPATHKTLNRKPSLYLLYSLWFGLVIGLWEAGYWAYQKLLFDTLFYRRVHFPGLHFTWGIPLGYVLLFVAIGLVIYVLARLWPRLAYFRVSVFLFTALGCAGWLFIVDGLHKLAAIVLAAGIAVQLARFLTKHTYLFQQVVRRTTAVLALLVLVLAVGLTAWQRMSENEAVAQLPVATEQAPNVLLIVLDTVRAKSLSLYGYDQPTTPELEAFAQRGVVFDRGISTSPWTLPAHGTMLTGRFPHEMSTSWLRPLDDTYPMLSELLREQGYLTAGFVANTTYCQEEFGLNRGFIHYEDHAITISRAVWGTSLAYTFAREMQARRWIGTFETFGRKSARRVNHEFLGWLSDQEPDRPFFAFLNYFDAHHPYHAPDEFMLKFSDERPTGYMDTLSPEEIEELNRAYDGTIAYLDHQLGLLFDALEERGVLDNTIVVVTSDHGEQFGEHDLVEHANSLYIQALHVPLLIVAPQHVPAGIRTDTFASIRDIPMTIAELTGHDDGAPFPGRSLSRLWNPPADTNAVSTKPDVILAESRKGGSGPGKTPLRSGKMKSIIVDGMHYIKNYGTEQEELYDLIHDLEEAHDLVAGDSQKVAYMRTHLEHLLQTTQEREDAEGSYEMEEIAP